MKTRTCPMCRQKKPLNAYPTPRGSVNFKMDKYRYSPCKSCIAERACRWRMK